MAFILLVRDGDAIRLFTPTVFESRQAALAELPHVRAIASSEELFLIDLDTATPVIVVSQEPASVPEAPVETAVDAEGTVGVWEAPAPAEEPSETAEAPAEEPAEELAPPPEVADDLPSALRRATGALESSGIAAPESVSLAPVEFEATEPEAEELATTEPEAEELATTEPEAEELATTEPEAEEAGRGVSESPAPEPEETLPVAEVAPAAWPWDVADEEPSAPAQPEPDTEQHDDLEGLGELTAITESLDAEGSEAVEMADGPVGPVGEFTESAPDQATPTLEETPEAYVPDPLEEPARDVETLVHADGGDEAVALSRPVIMGSYDTVDGSISIEVPTTSDEPAGSEGATGAPVEVPAPAPLEAAPAPPVIEALVKDAPSPEVSESLAGVAEEAGPAEDEEPAAYEAGASDIGELTCEECVYLATCPKKGESDPSSCGSFQWKSV